MVKAAYSTDRLTFYFGTSLVVCHELDAIERHEWRMFPLLNALDDKTAQIVFVLLHVPAFTVLFWLVSHPFERTPMISQAPFDAFLIGHGLAHLLLSGHREYTFQAPLEEMLLLAVRLWDSSIWYWCAGSFSESGALERHPPPRAA